MASHKGNGIDNVVLANKLLQGIVQSPREVPLMELPEIEPWRALKHIAISVTMGVLLTLPGCGGGGGSDGAALVEKPVSSSNDQLSPADAVGLWNGTGREGANITAVVLESGEYFAIYSVLDNPQVARLVQGSGELSGSEFSSLDAIDSSFTGAGTVPRDLQANVEARVSFNGTLTADADPSDVEEISLTFNPLYDLTPSMSQVAGLYYGMQSSEIGFEPYSVTIDDSGGITITDRACFGTGTIRPHEAGNIYDIEMSFGAWPCALSGQPVSGIGLYDADRKQLLLALVDESRSHGLVFSGSKISTIDSDGDGIIDYDDMDDDNDGVTDEYDECPLDPNSACVATILADGKEWLQPVHFRGLSWDDINNACPALNEGTCSGTLSGYDMIGWTWASAAEVGSLFDSYGFEAQASGSESMAETASYEWSIAGWMPTAAGCPWDTCNYGFAGITRDSFHSGANSQTQGHVAAVALLYAASPIEITADAAMVYGHPSHYHDEGVGGWFYRNP